MRGKRNARSGVTLIELLIAVTLVALLATGILFCMRLGFDTMSRTNARLMANRRVLGAQRVLDQQLNGMIPVMFSCGTQGGSQGLFFQGEPGAMRLVSRYTLEEAARGYPRIVEYLIIPDDRGMGVRLVMNEFFYTGPQSLGYTCGGMSPDPTSGAPRPVFRPVLLGPKPFVIADKLASCRFSYLIQDSRNGKRAWSPAFVGGLPPAAIRVEMYPFESEPARLQMTTITVPIHVNPDPTVKYVDIEPQP